MENGNNNDDSRKKRDSTEVVEGGLVLSEEKTKKLRASRKPRSTGPPSQQQVSRSQDETFNNGGVLVLHEESNGNKNGSVINNDNGSPVRRTSSFDFATKGKTLDLEIALQQVVRMSDSADSKEYLSNDKWVTFRLGHAGDAATLASCYRKMKDQQQQRDDGGTKKSSQQNHHHTSADDTSLEVRLAEGLGDEDTPPAIFALIADISSNNDETKQCTKSDVIAAAALMSIAFEDTTCCRTLRVEWIYITDDDDLIDVSNLLSRRLWLRLSALAMMTSCQVLVANNVSFNNVDDNNKRQQQQQKTSTQQAKLHINSKEKASI